MEKSDLIPLFEAWYDQKMNPESNDYRLNYNTELDKVVRMLEELGDQPLTRADVRSALFQRFGQ